MTIKVNASCNVKTEEDATGFRSFGKTPKPQITVPAFKLRLSIVEAAQLATHLNQAVTVAEMERLKATPNLCGICGTEIERGKTVCEEHA